MRQYKDVAKAIEAQKAQTEKTKDILQQQLAAIREQEERNSELEELSRAIEGKAMLRRKGLQDMIATVCAAHCISAEELRGRRRFSHLIRAREDAIRIMSLAGYSLPEMGRALGNRDHTTILHHRRKMDLDPVENLGQINEARPYHKPRPA